MRADQDQDGRRWKGLHPYRFLTGYAVVERLPTLGVITARHTFTRRGAERLANRLRRDRQRRLQWASESGSDQRPDVTVDVLRVQGRHTQAWLDGVAAASEPTR